MTKKINVSLPGFHTLHRPFPLPLFLCRSIFLADAFPFSSFALPSAVLAFSSNFRVLNVIDVASVFFAVLVPFMSLEVELARGEVVALVALVHDALVVGLLVVTDCYR